MPIVNVSLIYGHATSPRFEAVVDSGSERCLFHSSVGHAIGLRVDRGIHGTLGGVVGTGKPADVYYHRVKLVVFADILDITAGFCDELVVAGLLGRVGFFSNYSVTFDPTSDPPGMDIIRVGRA